MQLAYDVVEIGEGEHIIPNAFSMPMAPNAKGELEPLTAGSTLPVTTVVHHAGIVRVQRYEFKMP